MESAQIHHSQFGSDCHHRPPERVSERLTFSSEGNVGFAKIHGALTSRIDQHVRFGAPKDVSKRGGEAQHGVIVDEVWADPTINVSPPRKRHHDHDWGDYSFFAQLIRWDHGRYQIRLGYYRRRAGENWWEFAGQTTVVSDWKTIKTLLGLTLAKKDWFCKSPERRKSRACARLKVTVD